MKQTARGLHTPAFPPNLPPLLIAGAVALVYANSLDGSFHFDDLTSIVRNPAIRDPWDFDILWQYMNRRIFGYWTFALNYRFGGLDVTGYHIVNALIHIVASIVAWTLALLIGRTPAVAGTAIGRNRHRFALVVAMMFALHPIQTQAVTYIVQRLASLSAMFYLSAAAFYLAGRLSVGGRRIPWFAGTAIAGILALFTKETAVTLPFAVLAAELWLFPRSGRRVTEALHSKMVWIAAAAGIAFMGILYLMLPSGFSFITAMTSSQRHLDPLLTSAVYMMTQFRVVPFYLRLCFFPAGQNIDHDIAASTGLFEPPATIAGLLFIALIFIVAIAKRRTWPAATFGIVWFFLALSVESTIKPLTNVSFEHRLYLPMFGFAVAISAAWERLVTTRRPAVGIAAITAVIIALGTLTTIRNTVWDTELSLWNDAIHKSPDKARPYLNVGRAWYNAGDYNRAGQFFREALKHNPGYAEAWNNLGNVLRVEGNFAGAVAAYDSSLRFDGENPEVLSNLGAAHYSSGDLDSAETILSKALALEPSLVEAHVNLGLVFMKMGDLTRAAASFANAVTLDPGTADAHLGLGRVHFLRGEYTESVEACRTALTIDPSLAAARDILGDSLFRLERYREAADAYESAARSMGESAVIHNKLGLTYRHLGDTKQALSHFQQAAELLPSAETHYQIGLIFEEDGNIEGTVAEYHKALSLDADHLASHVRLAQYYDTTGQSQLARFHYLAAERISKSRHEDRQ